MNRSKTIKGQIIKIESKDYYVKISGGTVVRLNLKGSFKKEYEYKKSKLFNTDIAVVGDFVEYEEYKEGGGLIHTILPRTNFISRKAPKIKGASYRGARLEQIVAANIDNLIIVSSVDQPAFNNKTIDRFIVTAKACKINETIVINKCDLDDTKFASEWANLYSTTGHKIILTSCDLSVGIDELKNITKNKINMFWGQSGVGKSSLINTLYPNANLRTGEISYSSNKGTHTTVTAIMLELDNNTYLIDTPGIREIEPYGVKKEDLCHYFNEFQNYIDDCKFNTCTHSHEPGCAIIQAVEKGHITQTRYESYLNLLETIEDDIFL